MENFFIEAKLVDLNALSLYISDWRDENIDLSKTSWLAVC